jgi:hypothetical protein
MTSPINLLDPLPRTSNFRRPDNVKFVCYCVSLPLNAKRICRLMYVCVCAETVPHPPPYKFISEGVKHAQRHMFYFEFMEKLLVYLVVINNRVLVFIYL